MLDIADVTNSVAYVVKGGNPEQKTQDILNLSYKDLILRLGIFLDKTNPYDADAELLAGIVIGFCAAYSLTDPTKAF